MSSTADSQTNSLEWQADVDRAIDEVYAQMVEVRRHMHVHPEPSGEEHETSMYLYGRLDDAGFQVQLGPEGRGVVAQPKTPDHGPRVALRADIDALRIHDGKDVPYRSQCDGVMHACGHDAHSGIVLGAILGLQAVTAAGRLPWPVCWRAIFQPAEETLVGAKAMVEGGFLKDIGAIFATHVDPTRPVGRIAVRNGALTAHCDAMRITVIGRGGHAARPHETADPIAAAAHLVSSIYLFVPRATDSQDAVVVSFGQIEGGKNANVIPERVELGGTLRTLDARVRDQTVEHIHKLARGLAEASGTTINVEFGVGIQSVMNDPGLTNLVRQVAASVLGADAVVEITRPSMGSEDFASYLDHVPGTMFRVGCSTGAPDCANLHMPGFDVDERAMAVAAKILARSTVAWFDPSRASR